MKQINNYILEKLHIDKNYKTDDSHEYISQDEFLKYLTSEGNVKIESTIIIDAVSLTIPKKRRIDSYPIITIKFKDDWFDQSHIKSKHDKMIYIRNSARNRTELFIDDIDLYDKDTEKFAYTKHNANILIKLLRNRETDK